MAVFGGGRTLPMAARVEHGRLVVEFSLPGWFDRSFARVYLARDEQSLSGEVHLRGGDISRYDQRYLQIRLDKVPTPELKPEQVKAQRDLAPLLAALPGTWHAADSGPLGLDHVLVVDLVQEQPDGWRVEARSAPSGCPLESVAARLAELRPGVPGLEVRERAGSLLLLQVSLQSFDAQSDLLQGRRVDANGVIRGIVFKRAEPR